MTDKDEPKDASTDEGNVPAEHVVEEEATKGTHKHQ